MIECVVINCMNGHMQLQIVSYTEKHFGILHTCFLTVAKPSYLIAANRDSKPAQRSLARSVGSDVGKQAQDDCARGLP